MYYLRSRPAVDAIKFTLNVEELFKATDVNDTEKALKCIGAHVDDEKQKKGSEVDEIKNKGT